MARIREIEHSRFDQERGNEMTARVTNDQLQLVVGWVPGANPEGSLAVGARSLIPALLYADKVRVICPESDNALEMSDYGALTEALPNAVDFLSLDSGYLRYDKHGKRAGYGPLEPSVFRELFSKYIGGVQAALNADHEEAAIGQLARVLVLLTQGAYQFDVESTLKRNLPGLSEQMVRAAHNAATFAVAEEVVNEYLMGVYTELASQPHSYALLDDSEGVLTRHLRGEAAERLSGWAAVRTREASLSTTVLRRLPSPKATEPWDVVADIRQRLQPSLRRFRAAMSEISAAAEAHPLEEDFDAYAEHVWRTRVAPALPRRK